MKYNTERVEGKLKNVKMLDYMASGVLGVSPLWSKEEGGESERNEQEQAPLTTLRVNQGWPTSSYYVPATTRCRVIKINLQPMELRTMIKAAILTVTSDAIHTTVYRPVDKLTSYYCSTLYISAKQLGLRGYVRRCAEDGEFLRALIRVVSTVLFVMARSLIKRHLVDS